MERADYKLFETLLKKHNIKKKEFAEYAHIPYNTVLGWKKREKVPAYALVIARDMAYRMQLNEKTRHQFQRRYKRDKFKVVGLKQEEMKRVEAAFWGSNYVAAEIIERVQHGDEEFIKQLKQNVPEALQHKILNAKVKHLE